MRKTNIGVIAVLSLFASVPFASAADDKAAQPGKMEMMRGMNDHMGDMEKRMGGMHQTMQGCMDDEKSCPMDKMMTDMQAMHAQMTKMMADMKSMHNMGQPKDKAAPKTKPEGHEEHHN